MWRCEKKHKGRLSGRCKAGDEYWRITNWKLARQLGTVLWEGWCTAGVDAHHSSDLHGRNALHLLYWKDSYTRALNHRHWRTKGFQAGSRMIRSTKNRIALAADRLNTESPKVVRWFATVQVDHEGLNKAVVAKMGRSGESNDLKESEQTGWGRS